MPDQKIPEQEPGRKHSFIREKVVRPPMSRGQIVRRVAVYLLIAVMAGAAAGAGFAVARPLAERYLATSCARQRASTSTGTPPR